MADEDILRATDGRHMLWVMVDEVTKRLQLGNDAVEAGIRHAEAKGDVGRQSTALCLPEVRG